LKQYLVQAMYKMNIQPQDIIPISKARARLTELADDVVTHGRHKVLTRNGESYVALVTADELEELEQFRQMQRQSDLRALAESAQDIAAGRVRDWSAYEATLAQQIGLLTQALPNAL